MQLGPNFAQNPSSKTEPPGTFKIKILNAAEQQLEETEVRFAYLDELDRMEALRAADEFADKRKIQDSTSRNYVRRGFVLARVLRDGKDVEKAVFIGDNKMTGGEVALRKLAYPAAREAMAAWTKWMEAEHLTNAETGQTRPPTGDEEQALEGEAQGEF